MDFLKHWFTPSPQGQDLSIHVKDCHGVEWVVDIYSTDSGALGLSVCHATDEDFCADINVRHKNVEEDDGSTYRVTWC